MLRALLGEPPREWKGALRDTADAMDAFIRIARVQAERRPDRADRYRTYAVWGEGLVRSLEELEESLFAAKFFASRIRHWRWAELSRQEKLDYDRHVYFDKNAYIRLFALLDKLATLVNDLLDLKTETIKPHFSYFTMLRRLRRVPQHAELALPLGELKERHREAMSRLRNRRNMEVHYMNAELKDDLKASLRSAALSGGRLENLASNMADAAEGWEMAAGTLGHTFHYACRWLRRD